ncbi:MAG: deoxyribodipyrimidine photo-lyase [Alphaproteobacteria bacterium]|jgi:deoxyribodipyrimidine photo-lyase|nr:deoxyribodipyrimidine photo-lyase [Alphaproteobacteria bacterium]
MPAPAIFWFRRDLRLHDNPALIAAADGRPIVPLFVLDDEAPGMRPLGGASRWWLHHSLAELAAGLERRGLELVLRRGPAARILAEIAAETGADSIFAGSRPEPDAIARDRALIPALRQHGVTLTLVADSLLFSPRRLMTGAGEPFKVFTPFWRAALALGDPPASSGVPGLMPGPACRGDDLDDWRLLPSTPDWAGGLRAAWQPGETAARDRLARFVDRGLGDYGRLRDLPAVDGTSRLSPHLAWGEISPRQVWHAVRGREDGTGAAKFLSEVGWREFSYHLLLASPGLAEANWRADFDRFPWVEDKATFRAWRRGETGYPMVDAGMRELRSTGYMHNRVRMIAGSFLVKHLLTDWRRGEAWFWDNLVDADHANNAASWQWVAGSGADAAPYFRIFNPVLQGERYDPDGTYVRRWLPELGGLPATAIHKPWTLAKPPRDYPAPIVDHRLARDRALAAFQSLKTK